MNKIQILFFIAFVCTITQLGAMERNYYLVLGLSSTATSSQIKRAFIELSKKNHPDKPGGLRQRQEEVIRQEVIRQEELKCKQEEARHGNSIIETLGHLKVTLQGLQMHLLKKEQ